MMMHYLAEFLLWMDKFRWFICKSYLYSFSDLTANLMFMK